MKTVAALLLLGVSAIGAQESSVSPGGAGNWQCTHEFGFYPHDTFCDKYYSCEAGVATLKTCGNGLAFDDTDPEFLRENCDYSHNVDCTGRPQLGLAQEDDFIYEDFVCPKDNGFFAHETQCDAYWSCKDGVPSFKLCGNGLAFDDRNDTREHCNYLFTVECGSRTELEPPISTPHCPNLYGIFPDPDDCAVFWSCWDGEASRYACAPGLAYDRKSRVCNWMDNIAECKQQRAAMEQDIQCPAPGELTATGSFSRHPHPEDCRQYFVCLDGVAREYGCPIGTVFQIGQEDGFGQCADPENVPGCADYYGDLDLTALRRSQLLLGNIGLQDSQGGSAPPAAPAPRPRRPVAAAAAAQPADTVAEEEAIQA